MEQAELAQIIEKARLDRSERLSLNYSQLTSLPDSISTLSNLRVLDISYNQLTSLPKNIGNLSNLSTLYLHSNKLADLPDSIGDLAQLTWLDLSNNQLASLPENITSLSELSHLDLSFNHLAQLPARIGKLSKLIYLHIGNNKIEILPQNLNILTNLTSLRIDRNPLVDLSILRGLTKLTTVSFLSVALSSQYWTKISDWKSQWLIDEDNAEIRSVLIKQIGYERICNELNTIDLGSWREYTLLKINGVETVDTIIDDRYRDTFERIEREPMVLLKMTCPSTEHIHILRVPPEMTSAESAITWVNHGIHPDKFAVQT